MIIFYEDIIHLYNQSVIFLSFQLYERYHFYDFYDRWAAFRAEVAPWVKSGKVSIAEDIAQGLTNGPELMEKLMTGKNVGKCVIAL